MLLFILVRKNKPKIAKYGAPPYVGLVATRRRGRVEMTITPR
jgi:hypothetical protein